MALTEEQKAIVKSTAPVVKQYGNTITTVFYRNMLTAHPELNNYFNLKNQQDGAQQLALANAVFAYASYIDDLPKLTSAVERIAQKHASLFIQPEQYAIVGKYLVGAFAEVLGDALTPDVADAWIAAYGQLADVFIKREEQLYDEAGKWKSWRKFRIARKEVETEHIVSVYLEPVDGVPLPAYKPGQYVSLQLALPELDGLLQSRQFSLSLAPEDNMKQYRVSVKKEKVEPGLTVQDLREGKVAGVISNRLHDLCQVGDEVNLSPPRGEFFFDAAAATCNAPIVLLSVGVGATPLVSILDSILNSHNPDRPVTWAHGARHAHTVCFGKHINSAIAAASNVKSALFVKNLQYGDKQGVDYDYTGRLSLDHLAEKDALFLDSPDAKYYICGPEDWMVKMRDELTAKGVAGERVHLELFKTGDV